MGYYTVLDNYRGPGFDCILKRLRKTPLSQIAIQMFVFCHFSGHVSLKVPYFAVLRFQ